MSPEQQNQVEQPTPSAPPSSTQIPPPISQPAQHTSIATQPVALRRHKKLALTLLIAPTVLFILAFICVLIASSQNVSPQDNALFGTTTPLKQTMNILGFLCGLVGFLTWLPGIIIGIILLTKKK